MYKDVISIQGRKVFDGYACKVILEDEDFNKGNDNVLADKEIGFLLKKDNLYFTQEKKSVKLNEEIIFLKKEQYENLKDKIKKINNKYGNCDWWRAKMGEEFYYYLEPDLTVAEEMDFYFDCDTEIYKIGNYFKTKAEALQVAKEIKELLKKHQDKFSKYKKIISEK